MTQTVTYEEDLWGVFIWDTSISTNFYNSSSWVRSENWNSSRNQYAGGLIVNTPTLAGRVYLISLDCHLCQFISDDVDPVDESFLPNVGDNVNTAFTLDDIETSSRNGCIEMDGACESYTEDMVEKYGANAPAAYWASNYTFKNGVHGYIPNAWEMLAIMEPGKDAIWDAWKACGSSIPTIIDDEWARVWTMSEWAGNNTNGSNNPEIIMALEPGHGSIFPIIWTTGKQQENVAIAIYC